MASRCRSLPPTRSSRYHDQLGAEGFLNVGAGLSYSLTHKVDVYALYAETVRGRNGHKARRRSEHGLHLELPLRVPASRGAASRTFDREPDKPRRLAECSAWPRSRPGGPLRRA